VRQLPVGEPQDTQTQALKGSIPGPIRLERIPMCVVLETIDLRDHCSVPPDEVDLIWAHLGIHLGRGKAVTVTQTPKEPLELAAGEVVVVSELGRRNQAEIQRAADSALVRRLAKVAVEVPESPTRLRDGDAVAAGRDTVMEGVGSVDLDPAALLSSPVSGKRDVDRAASGPQHPPHRRRGLVTNYRAVT
jgi:hypothetical protein